MPSPQARWKTGEFPQWAETIKIRALGVSPALVNQVVKARKWEQSTRSVLLSPGTPAMAGLFALVLCTSITAPVVERLGLRGTWCSIYAQLYSFSYDSIHYSFSNKCQQLKFKLKTCKFMFSHELDI